ncbi:YheC/YheD family protein [Paenibacillus sp. sgz302251]|uniref:YheC/YheD family endospore coat-associated protein n=1 Tax=Paenibacillus sp. sgz302251 TaxID=3414493 RepID=UPI003C7E630D
MIGILYARSMLSRLFKGKHCFEKPAFYMEAARHVGEDILFFSLSDIDWKKGTVRGWNGADPVRLKLALPPVIINRTRTNQARIRKLILRLKQMGMVVFNEHNVVSKLEIHHILSKSNEMQQHLPETDVVTYRSVKHLLEQNTSLFLKPSTTSIGNGIIRIRKINKSTFAEINVLGHTKRKKVNIDQIINMVRRQKRDYLVQRGVSLMTYQGNSVDFRVSVQKNGEGNWQCTGIVGRVAKKGAVVTNLHCGGKSLKAAELFQKWGWNAAEIEKKVAELGLSIAQTLDKELPHIADLGLDIALDEQQYPWLIEVNFRDLRITFRNAGERGKWRATFANPVYYATYLNRKIKEQEMKLEIRGLDKI